VDAELAFHLEMRAQEYAERGLDADAARAEAIRRMGDLERVRGTCRTLGEARERDMERTEYIDEIRSDLRFGLRQLLRAPALTAVAVLTLALGIGATAAIFGVVDAVVLRPLPFDAPERVMRLRAIARAGEASSVSAANFLDWRSQGASRFERMAAKVGTGMAYAGRDVPVRLDGARVSADYFRVFGVRPMLGRDFHADDDEAGRGDVVVLAARTWATYFDSDPRVLGRRVLLNDRPYTVIGVMPASFDFLAESDELWVPLAFTPTQRANRGAGYLEVYGRLRRGVSVAGAQAAMDAVARRLDAQYEGDNDGQGIRVI
jgi:putative ABC transport system permease protein